jgi:hypothetical protein
VTSLAAYAGLVGFAWLALFQFLLAAGLPLGRLAWGGAQAVLPPLFRIASLASAGIAVLGALAVAQASGMGPDLLPDGVLRPVLWALSILFALSLVGNLASSSRAERLHGVPLTLILAASTATVALTGPA